MSAIGRVHTNQVKLEQFDMSLGSNITLISNGGILFAARAETEYLNRRSRSEVQAERNRSSETAGHTYIQARIQRHPAMVHEINILLPSSPKWPGKESGDMLKAQANGYTSTRLKQTADTTTDCNTARNATCANR
jgi:pyocin large subunit-like protein